MQEIWLSPSWNNTYQLQATYSREANVLHCSYVYKGIVDAAIHEGNINREVFSDFISQSFVPLLQPVDGKNSGSIVIIDNTSIHHVEEVATTIQNRCNSPLLITIIALITINWKNPLQKSKLS